MTTNTVTLPRQLSKQEVDELYILTALLEPYTAEKK
jgi:hypothetical protein